jgi:1,3-beta-glucan synthase
LYFILLVVFLALIVGPIVAGKNILSKSLTDQIPQKLFQPIHQNNNDTQNRTETGTGAKSAALASATATATLGSRQIRLF